MATPLNQRIEKDIPWVRLLSFEHFRNYHIRAQVNFTSFLRAKVMQEMALLIAIRTNIILKTFGEAEIVPVLLAGPKQVLNLENIEEFEKINDECNGSVSAATTVDNTDKEIQCNDSVSVATISEKISVSDRDTQEIETEEEKGNEETSISVTERSKEAVTERPKESQELSGYVFSIANFDLKPNPKGGGICNRIVMAGSNEFMEDLLGVHVKYGIDPNFNDAKHPDSNLYLKAYLRYVFLFFIFLTNSKIYQILTLSFL
jgi:hypothetical protein